MMKTVLRIFIIASFGLFILTVINPDLVSPTVDKVLNYFIEKKSEYKLSTKDIKKDFVEPIKNSSSGVLSYFRNDNQEVVGELNYINVIEATNKERIKVGLPPLAVNNKLVDSARLKTNDMIVNQYFEHTSPTGVNVSDLGKKVGYDYVIMGENLALGDFANEDDLLQAWMNSPGHRENILNKTYQEIGVYVAKGYYKNKEVWFAVQHFGTPRSVCPNISTSLKSEIDQMNKELKERGDDINALRAELEGSLFNDDEYKAQVAEFNALVAEYNQMLLISQQKIKDYNVQIASFNKCLSIYQKH